MTWCPPAITLKWGAYFAPDTDDDAKLVDSAIKAHDGGLVTLRSAVERVARTFGIENVEAYLDALAEEKAAKQKQLAADMHAMGGDPADDEPDDAKVVKKSAGDIVGKTKPDVEE